MSAHCRDSPLAPPLRTNNPAAHAGAAEVVPSDVPRCHGWRDGDCRQRLESLRVSPFARFWSKLNQTSTPAAAREKPPSGTTRHHDPDPEPASTDARHTGRQLNPRRDRSTVADQIISRDFWTNVRPGSAATSETSAGPFQGPFFQAPPTACLPRAR